MKVNLRFSHAKPSIAIFTYSNAGYGLIEVKEGEKREVVTAEYGNYLFVYIDAYYSEDTATIRSKFGDTYRVNALEQKEELIVK